ncbi:MAG: hypothetical protein AAB652_01565 [Patescibacteria group bacterium]
MKKVVLLFAALGLLLFFGVSTANQEVGVSREETTHFTLTSFLYDGGRSVSFEVFADGIMPRGARKAFLSGSLDLHSGFGFTKDSIYFSRLALPDGALQIRADGKKIFLDVDLSEIQDFRAFRRANGGTLSEITDPSVFPSMIVSFVWEVGKPIPTYGGKIQSFYARPDGEWTRSVITNLKRNVQGTGEIFGFRSSAARIRNFEYTEEGSEVSVSSDGIFPPVISFPKDPTLPEEP